MPLQYSFNSNLMLHVTYNNTACLFSPMVLDKQKLKSRKNKKERERERHARKTSKKR